MTMSYCSPSTVFKNHDKIYTVRSEFKGVPNMPRGDKSKYSDKQKREAQHIEESYEKKGVDQKEAQRIAWATVNKQTGGAAKKGN